MEWRAARPAIAAGSRPEDQYVEGLAHDGREVVVVNRPMCSVEPYAVRMGLVFSSNARGSEVVRRNQDRVGNAIAQRIGDGRNVGWRTGAVGAGGYLDEGSGTSANARHCYLDKAAAYRKNRSRCCLPAPAALGRQTPFPAPGLGC
jgi:hypothetical protein